MRRGRFITLEGGEGAGKSTQARRLATALRGHGLEVIETREPGGAPGAEHLRAALFEDPAGDRWDAVSEALILAAARRNHIRHTIRPALERGAWVVCDRFADSTTAYQGYGHGVSLETLEMLYDLAAGPFTPDLTLILDVPARFGLSRAAARGVVNRFEGLDLGFHERVHLGFHEIAAIDPERCALIDAMGDEDTVAARVMATMDARMAQWTADADVVDGAAPVDG
ncbi:dTMP kinase [Roseospira navarrensis]|uniref:Thymidylate kinase n=1 Tax=Roseospira navarrensis TaxID=140058 RepID=A0A7X1ZFB4_9PROT|nr:dTMP kinase [Roseospira navarrensis]MQX36979.1 dTMP kinase [Roseospira navarrensis]